MQLEDMDHELRVSLWNVLEIFVWSTADYKSGGYGPIYPISETSNKELYRLSRLISVQLLNSPLDKLGNDWEKVKDTLRECVYHGEWFEVFDLIEFIAQRHRFRDSNTKFIDNCNYVLEKEMSGYRFVGGQISPITETTEVAEIDEALDNAKGPVRTHLNRALELLSDRDKRDYRNSVKESISAVESLVAIEVESDKGTLGQLLKLLEKKTGLHPALKEAFSKLYGFTSSKDGIRHALLKADTVDFHDAKFMLVTCSAFVNYVHGKEQGASE